MSVDFSAALRLGAFAYDAEFRAADEIVVLFGHSGAGKSVTLQAIAGLVRPERGRITVGDQVVFDSAELWGADADPTVKISIDAFEPYLERA